MRELYKFDKFCQIKWANTVKQKGQYVETYRLISKRKLTTNCILNVFRVFALDLVIDFLRAFEVPAFLHIAQVR